MEVLLPIVGIAASLCLIQILLGIYRGGQMRRVYNYLLEDARKRARQPFAIVVFLDRRASTLFPLLDHLQSLDYKKLQIIVVVKQTAGSKAASELQSYRRRHTATSMRIIRYKKGLSLEAIAKRYITNTYIMTMAPNDRLSPRFFLAASQILVSSNKKILAVREILRPAGSFSQALSAVGSLYFYASLPFTRQNHVSSARILIQKQALMSGKVPPATYYLPSQWYIAAAAPASAIHKPNRATSITTLAAGVVALATYLTVAQLTDPATTELYGYIILLTPVVLTIIIMLSLKGYSFIDYLNVALFVPLAPLYVLFFLGIQGVKRVIAPQRRQLSVLR